MSVGHKVRIGIDVGGTFTKAVVIEDETYKIIGKVAILTTHYAPEGVAKGVIDVFKKTLRDFKINTDDVVLIAHSTTQATNALLEGDVAPVGIVGMGRGIDGLRARGETSVKSVELAQGRMLRTYCKFIDTSNIDKEKIKQCIYDLTREGAKVVVASETYGVDDPTNELLVMEQANELGILSTGGHEITKLYGLRVRTRTATINASILPKMMETANMTEQAIRKAGIQAPLMIMRGDGGVMDINEMRKRPILTMLSGPSASVAGALMYLRVSDGIFFEVGGTSTNIGVIRFGRPTLEYAEVGGHKTYLNSLDVRTIGIAGGSMVRIRGNEIIDVGPRSAHIAGLPYSSFMVAEEITNPRIVLIQPKPGDLEDYVAIKTASGKTAAITNTCAANVLGMTKKGDYAYGNVEAANKAIGALADKLGMTIEDVARRILEISSAKIILMINELIKEYKLDRGQVVLVGGGGGAAALIPFTAKALDLDYKISENAEVISSIGVALAMVRDVVERTVVNPTSEDVLRVRKEAEQAAMKAGAAPETIEVFVEVDPKMHKLKAIALGSTELRTKEMGKKTTLEEKKSIAAKSMRVSPKDVELVATTGLLDVFSAQIKEKKFLGFSSKKLLVRVLDKDGFIRLNATDASIIKSSVEHAIADLKKYLVDLALMTEGGLLTPKPFILCGGRVLDYSGVMEINQVVSLAEAELKGMPSKNPAILILIPRKQY